MIVVARFLSLGVFTFYFLISQSLFADTGSAIVASWSGQVNIVNDKGQKQTASDNAEVPQGWTIETGQNSLATLKMPDNSRVDLGSNTKMKIHTNNSSNVGLELDSGKLKAVVTKKISGQRWFKIRSHGVTMGVRGTQFLVSVLKGNDEKVRSEFYCLQGSVEVSDPSGKRLGLLAPHEGISVETLSTAQGSVLQNHPQTQQIPSQLFQQLTSDPNKFLKSSAAPASVSTFTSSSGPGNLSGSSVLSGKNPGKSDDDDHSKGDQHGIGIMNSGSGSAPSTPISGGGSSPNSGSNSLPGTSPGGTTSPAGTIPISTDGHKSMDGTDLIKK